MTEAKDGIDYQQNYDIILKWLAEEFRGKTLKILGIETGQIIDVFTTEPIRLPLKAERLDIIVLDDIGYYYHIEEQRNMTKADLYRFASSHFFLAKKYEKKLKDIILFSGVPYTGDGFIETLSGKYEPEMINMTDRNGKERLGQIKQTVLQGKTENLLELVFIPLYGISEDDAPEELIVELLDYETSLFHQGLLSKRLVAATMIMSNKVISKDLLNKYWEELQMYDIFELAHEKGMEKGMEKGRTQHAQEVLLDVLNESIGAVPPKIIDSVYQISREDVLNSLVRQAIRCKEINQFQKSLELVME
jgi:hypothetical protein